MKQKSPKVPIAVYIAVVLSLLFNIIAIIVALNNPSGKSYPASTQVESVKVDYNYIEQLIRKQLDSLSAPQAGRDGKDGRDGRNSVSTYTKEIIVKETPGATGEKGETGQPGKTPEFQYNYIKQQAEWRYIGDFTWRVLIPACAITATCPEATP